MRYFYTQAYGRLNLDHKAMFQKFVKLTTINSIAWAIPLLFETLNFAANTWNSFQVFAANVLKKYWNVLLCESLH